MTRNTTGGNRNKSAARKQSSSSGGRGYDLRFAESDQEIYAIVTQMLGGSNIAVLCIDGQRRRCVMRGKFTGKRRRQNRVEPGSIVLVGKREYLAGGDDAAQPVDLLEIYDASDVMRLKATEMGLAWGILTLENKHEIRVHESNDGIEFSNADPVHVPQAPATVAPSHTHTTDQQDDCEFDDI